MKTITASKLTLVAMFVMAMFMQPAHAAELVASDAKIFLPKDDSTMMVGVVTLKNTSDKEIMVIKVRSSSFKLSMIHQGINDSGVQRMMLKSEIILKPGVELKMSPGGVHFMFAGPASKLKKGSTVTANLYLKSGEKFPVSFDVVK